MILLLYLLLNIYGEFWRIHESAVIFEYMEINLSFYVDD